MPPQPDQPAIPDPPPPSTLPDLAALIHDPERLAAVHRTGLLDSEPDGAFDRLTRLAVQTTGAPVAFVSLIDAERDFYKSHCGFGDPLANTRQVSGTTFCHYALRSTEPLIIPDTRADPVYRQVPTVETLGVAAYAGIPLVSAEGHVLGSFCVIDFEPREWSTRDVGILQELAASALREVELQANARQAEAQAKAAEDALRLREEVLGVVTHDLRNPLNAIFMSAALMLDVLPDDDDHMLERRQFGIIKRASTRMERLIQDLLDMSRIEAGRLTVQVERISVAPLIGEALEMLQPLAAEAGLRLQSEVPPELPPVQADRDRLLQVFSNLAGNAIKFTPAGGTVTLRAADEGGHVRFTVADTGTGIAAEHLPNLFNRFWQGAHADRRGVGLGLSIVRGIVDAHGGALDVVSEPGVGSAFSFTIPAAPAPAEPRPHNEP